MKAALQDTGLTMLGSTRREAMWRAVKTVWPHFPAARVTHRRRLTRRWTMRMAIAAANVHVMAGKAAGPAARDTFVRNLSYAAQKAAAGASPF